MKVYGPWSPEPETVLLALEALEQDRSAWTMEGAREEAFLRREFEAELEKLRQERWFFSNTLARMRRQMLPGDPTPLQFLGALGQRVSDEGTLSEALVRRALTLADELQASEAARARRSLARLRLALQLFPDEERFKRMLYFGDTLRSHPGEHLFAALNELVASQSLRSGGMTETAIQPWAGAYASTAPPEWETLLDAASAARVRIYSVESRSLNAGDLGTVEAQATLRALGLETGGDAFLNGAEAERIADSVWADLNCAYLLSFDPSQLPRGQPLRLRIAARRRNVELRAPGRVVIRPARSGFQDTWLTSVFATRGEKTRRAAAGWIPISWRPDGSSALVQVGLSEPLPGARIRVRTANGAKELLLPADEQATVTPLYAETVVHLPADDPNVVVVAEREGRVEAFAHLEVVWQRTRGGRLHVSPVIILQPATGWFVRETERRTSGSVLIEQEPLDPERPAAAVMVICGIEAVKHLSVERWLEGTGRTPFEPITAEPGHGSCVQIRDVLPAGTLGGGFYRYAVRLTSQGRTLYETARAFEVRGRVRGR